MLTGRRWTGLYREASNVAGGARKGARLRMVGLQQNSGRRERGDTGWRSADLLDGSDVSEQLRELKLGVRTENIEVVQIEEQWFESV